MHALFPFRIAAVCATTLAFCGCSSKTDTARTDTADARLRAIYSEEWKWREEQFPNTEDAGKKIADHLPKVDPAAQARRLEIWQDVLKKLEAIPRAELSPAESFLFDIINQ